MEKKRECLDGLSCLPSIQNEPMGFGIRLNDDVCPFGESGGTGMIT